MIGLSISFCIADICRGTKKLEDVEKIVAGTKMATPEDVEGVLASYKETYWRLFPDKAERLFRQLWDEGKIYQPRLNDGWAPNIARGHWVTNESKTKRHPCN
jgi:hypothetical protein